MEEVNKIEELENFKNIKNFISINEATKNGYNLKVSTNVMAKVLTSKLRSKYHFEIKNSKKLMGVNSETGADLYRHSTLLRLIPIERSDNVQIDNIEYYVKKITHNKIVLQNIETGKITQANFDVFQKKKWKSLNFQE